MDPKPTLLIAGTGRSGTTAFRKMVESHSRVCSIPEWRYLTDPRGLVEFISIARCGNPFIIDQAYKRLSSLFKEILRSKSRYKIFNRVMQLLPQNKRRLTLPYLGTSPETELPGITNLINQLLADLSCFEWEGQYAGTGFLNRKTNVYIVPNEETLVSTISKFIKNVEQLALQHYGNELFVDKNTWSICHYDTIRKFYVTPRLINLVRDPRDVVASFVEQPWMPNDFRQSAHIVAGLHTLWEEAKVHVPEDDYMEIRFEDLLIERENTFAKIKSFWGIDLNEAKIQLDQNQAHVGRYKDQFSISERRELDLLLVDVLEKYEYKN